MTSSPPSALLGQRAPLSSSTILRLKEDWRAEYTVWRRRPISQRYPYIWADGIYLGVGTEVKLRLLLVVIGARADGRSGPRRARSFPRRRTSAA